MPAPIAKKKTKLGSPEGSDERKSEEKEKRKRYSYEDTCPRHMPGACRKDLEPGGGTRLPPFMPPGIDNAKFYTTPKKPRGAKTEAFPRRTFRMRIHCPVNGSNRGSCGKGHRRDRHKEQKDGVNRQDRKGKKGGEGGEGS